MNYLLVARTVGGMLMLLATAMGICLALGYVLPPGAGHNPDKALTGWEISMAITAVVATALMIAGRSTRGVALLRRDAIGAVGLGWLACSLFGALPYLFCEPGLSLSSAYFESVSGLTTTGATVFDDLSVLPETILLWRSLSQWIGGMGILAMFVLVLSRLGASGRSLFQTESSAHVRELKGTRMSDTVRSLWILYILITAVCALGLWGLGMTPFQAVNHAMTTTSTGGFGTEADSIEGFGVSIRIWLIVFMFVCGMSFPLYLALLQRGRDWTTLRRHEETWTFALMLALVSMLLVVDRHLADQISHRGFEEVLDTVFNAVSIATTTGFVVGDYDSWPMLAKGLILFLTLVGGCAGSTAGGLKVSRLLLWLKELRSGIRRAYRPTEVVKMSLNGHPVPEGTRGQLFVILTSAAAAIAVSSYLLAGFEHTLSVDGCVSAVISCVSNVGPAFEEFGPTHNFSSLSPPGLLLLSLLMVLGRLEYIAVLVLFSKTLWRKY